MQVGKSHSLTSHAVDVGSGDERIAVLALDVTKAEVIGEDVDDVGRRSSVADVLRQ